MMDKTHEGDRHLASQSQSPLPFLFSLGIVPEILLLDEALKQRKQHFSSITERRSLSSSQISDRSARILHQKKN